jgi:RND superfamily putative drug exporter
MPVPTPQGDTALPAKNFAARAGRWSAQHRKTAIFGWLAFVIVAFVIGGNLGTKTLSEKDLGVGDSGRAAKIVDSSFPEVAGEQVFIQSKTEKATDPGYRAAVRDIEHRLAANADVRKLKSPYGTGNPGQISPDGHSALVNFDIAGDPKQAQDKVDAILATTAAAQKAHPNYRIEQFGGASAGKAVDKMFADDLHKAETISLPVTLIILLFAFGALVAAGLPLLLGLTAVLGTMGIVAGVSQFAPATDNLMSVVLLIGLAVGVDYSLFYIRREREERKAGRDPEAALQAAAATSGRTVLVSGFTVMAAMAGMYLTGDKGFSSMATGTILVVGVAMAGSLTVLPALLSKLGDNVDRGRIPFIGKRAAARTESRTWSWILDRVLKRPLAAAVISGALLVGLSIPAFGLHTANAGNAAIPQNTPVMKTYNRITAAFPGVKNSAQVVVKADDVTKPPVAGAIHALEQKATKAGTAIDDITTDVSRDHTVATIDIPIAGSGSDARSETALTSLRSDLVPATVGNVPGAEALVSGDTAANKDYNDMLKAHAPIVFLFVLGLAFLLLLTTFRSIVIPIKAIILNLLSVGAAYGVLVMVFQKGWGESLLGFKSTGAIEPFLPLFLFVILFGLSMDYHVFIISRIREAVDRGMSTDDAVAHGIKTTASTVSSAAVVMVAVFGIFAILSSIIFKEIGVGLAVAILIDATIVRGVLLPASMKLLGERNWYLPQKLGWLPKLHHEPEAVPVPA